jgi:hypothetical protein
VIRQNIRDENLLAPYGRFWWLNLSEKVKRATWERIILKSIFKKWDGDWTGLDWF